ncbi:hypothetical protein Golax_001698, partial [Gossypium laxum]|nr:hypothetical protein [Gossypium laxum]
MREKDGHKSENKQTEEVNSIEKEIDVLNGVPKSIEEIPMETCLGGKENAEQESSKAMNLENNGEAKRVREDKHKRKNKDGIDAVATVTETFVHSKMQEPVETEVCEKQKKKKKLEKVNGNVADDIAAMSS